MLSVSHCDTGSIYKMSTPHLPTKVSLVISLIFTFFGFCDVATAAREGRDMSGSRAGGRQGGEGGRAERENCAIALVIFQQRGVMT